MITLEFIVLLIKVNNKKIYRQDSFFNRRKRFEYILPIGIHYNHRPLYMAMNKYNRKFFSVSLLRRN